MKLQVCLSIPDEQGDTTRRVLVMLLCKGGTEWSYAVKVMANLVPIAAAAVLKPQGTSPTLENLCPACHGRIRVRPVWCHNQKAAFTTSEVDMRAQDSMLDCLTDM